MGKFEIFLIRLVIAMLLAALIGRIYFRDTPLIGAAGLGAVLLGLAYLFEYVRKRDKGGDNGH
jgi:4-amino-4-deoxy-L-arabinose transferase-like glycosyltransferase